MNAQPLPQLHLSASRRKALVMVQVLLSLPVLLVLVLQGVPQKGEWLAALGLVALVVLGAVLHTTLALSIGNICQGKLQRLDERERVMRDEAFTTAFTVIKALLSVAWIYAMLAWLFGWWLPSPSQIWLLLWWLAMQAYGMPTSVAAYRMPDPIES